METPSVEVFWTKSCLWEKCVKFSQYHRHLLSNSVQKRAPAILVVRWFKPPKLPPYMEIYLTHCNILPFPKPYCYIRRCEILRTLSTVLFPRPWNWTSRAKILLFIGHRSDGMVALSCPSFRQFLLLLRLDWWDPGLWTCWVHATSPCLCWIERLELSKLLHGFVKVVTWIC